MYDSFAKVYDDFMDNVPYDFWTEQTVRILRSYGINDGLVCDLGCGTGNLTERLSDCGYDMIGIDRSAEMLSEAMNKQNGGNTDDGILYLCQDMREFELYGTVRAFVSRCDSINYITEFDELVQVFKLINNYLDPGGIFIFDVKSEFMYRDILGCNTFARSADSGTYIWQNMYYPDEKINEYELTLFIKREDGLFERSSELHAQRAYSPEELKAAAEAAGLIFECIADANTEEEADGESERFIVVLREHGK